MKSSTGRSELVRLDLQTEEVKRANVRNLQRTYIIGVYGKSQADYAISVT
jgi:hypothetical protein